MTVIAYKNGILASDSLLSGGMFEKVASCQKIKKVKGWLIGGAGDFEPTEAFMARFDPSVVRKNHYVPFLESGSSCCELLAISPKGEIYLFSPSGVFGKITGPYYAIGIGGIGAMCAMSVGASAEQAVRAAIKHCGACGGKVQVIKLGKD